LKKFSSKPGLRLESDIAHDDDLATFLRFRGENNVITLLPALDNKCLAREHSRSKARIHLNKALRVLRAVFLLDNTRTKAVLAEAMKDWHLEATLRRHLGIDMKRILIAQQAVHECLVSLRGLFFGKVRLTLRYSWETRFDCTLVSEATSFLNEHTGPDSRVELTCFSREDVRVKN